MSSLNRFPDWPSRLDYFLVGNAQRPFSYGTWDCCLFVADAIIAMTGVDIASPFRPSEEYAYHSRRSSRRAIQDYCGSPSVDALASCIAAKYDMPEIHPNHASAGDMASIRRPFGPSLGLISPNGMSVLTTGEVRDTGGDEDGRDGVGAIPLCHTIRAWRVGV